MTKNKYIILKDIGLTLGLIIGATLLGALFHYLNLHQTNIVVIYIFSILLISRFTTGYYYGIASSVVSVFVFNFFFTDPIFTFKVNDATYLITFAIMVTTSIVTSALTTKALKNAAESKEKELESNALYQMTNHLTDAEDEESIAKIIIKICGEILSTNTVCILFDEMGVPEDTYIELNEEKNIERKPLENKDELKKRIDQLHSTVDISEEYYYYPIYGNSAVLMVLRLPKSVGESLKENQKRVLFSIIESASLALTRLRSIKAQAKSREETSQERYRSNLLRAISHDIRTPLAGIIGTSEILINSIGDDEKTLALAKDINDDAEFLRSIVENILNLTKINDGKLIINKKAEAVEEVIGVSLNIINKRAPNRIINVELTEQVLMVPMDASLISQVFVNLLDNAIKHTPEDTEVTIYVKNDDKNAIITVADQGEGIKENDLSKIFQIFYTTRTKDAGPKRGVGLGLSICQSIVEAHGGSITAKNGENGGAEFTFTLPLGE